MSAGVIKDVTILNFIMNEYLQHHVENFLRLNTDF